MSCWRCLKNCGKKSVDGEDEKVAQTQIHPKETEGADASAKQNAELRRCERNSDLGYHQYFAEFAEDQTPGLPVPEPQDDVAVPPCIDIPAQAMQQPIQEDEPELAKAKGEEKLDEEKEKPAESSPISSKPSKRLSLARRRSSRRLSRRTQKDTDQKQPRRSITDMLKTQEERSLKRQSSKQSDTVFETDTVTERNPDKSGDGDEENGGLGVVPEAANENDDEEEEEEEPDTRQRPKFQLNITDKLLGKGDFAFVRFGELVEERQDLISGNIHKSRKPVAVKIPHIDDEQSLNRLKAAWNVLGKCSHSAIRQAIWLEETVLEEARRFVLILRPAPGYTLSMIGDILTTKRTTLRINEVLVVLKQLASALEHLHSKRIMHRDLNPTNIMVDAAGRLTLIDFDQAILVAGKTLPDLCCGAEHYRAPEVEAGEAYTFSADIYSYGCVAYFLLENRPVLEGRAPLGRRPKEQSLVHLEKFVEVMLHPNAYRRPTAKELRRNAYIAKVNMQHQKEWQFADLVISVTDRRALEIVVKDYQIDLARILGTGSFGTVYVAWKGEDIFAAKLIRVVSMEQAVVDALENEIQIQQKLEHKSICKLHEAYDMQFCGERTKCLILEYFPGKDMTEVCEALREAGSWFEASEVQLVVAQLVHMLGYLDTMQVIHLDFKPENLLLNEFGMLKLIDFSLAVQVGPQGFVREQSGTAGYKAPEVVSLGLATTKADVFSVGCILYELIFGKALFGMELTDDECDRMLLKGDYPFPDTQPGQEDAVALLKRMLEKDVKLRISSQDLQSHAYFVGVYFRTLWSNQVVREFSRKTNLFETF